MFTYASKALGVAKIPPGPPGGTDPYFNLVSMLLHMDGANGGTTFTDQKNHTVSRIGNTVTSTSQVKFGTASAFFDSSSALSASGDDLALGSGDFTIELWVYPASYSPAITLICISAASGGSGLLVQLNNTGLIAIGSAAVGFATGSINVPINQWSHIAVSRSNTNQLRTFVNGVQDISITNGTNFTNTTCYIGQFADGSQRFSGYIDDVRVTRNIGRYTTSFTPPTAAFPNAGGPDPFFANVVLLTTNDSTSFNDAKGHALTANGTVSMSTAQTKFMPYSLFTNGVGYLTAADSNDWDFGSGDFTIEAWAYQTNPSAGYVGTIQGIVEQAVLGTFGNGAFDAALSSGSTIGNLHIGAGNNNFNGSTPMSSNVWHHLCWERAGNTVRCYIDGVVQATITVSGAVNPSTHPLALGADSAGQGMFVGYLGQTRITKGVARYNGAFPIPTEAFPAT